MLRMKDTNKALKNLLSALPFLAPKKTPILPFVLAAIGVAVVGGIAAVMVFSPRTRYRALDIAKDRYGKVRGQFGGLRRHAAAEARANGLVNESGSSYPSTL
jgi:hypothetical protein